MFDPFQENFVVYKLVGLVEFHDARHCFVTERQWALLLETCILKVQDILLNYVTEDVFHPHAHFLYPLSGMPLSCH